MKSRAQHVNCIDEKCTKKPNRYTNKQEANRCCWLSMKTRARSDLLCSLKSNKNAVLLSQITQKLSKNDNCITTVLIHVINGPFGYNCCCQCKDCFHKVPTRFCNDLHSNVRWEEFVKGSIYYLWKLKHQVCLLRLRWRHISSCKYLPWCILMLVMVRIIIV